MKKFPGGSSRRLQPHAAGGNSSRASPKEMSSNQRCKNRLSKRNLVRSDKEGKPITMQSESLVPPIEQQPSEKSKIVMKRFAVMCLAKGADSIIKEFNDLKVSCPTPNELGHDSFDRNTDKNRYKDIICVEETRVRVIWPPDMNDYIHANWIMGVIPDLRKQIIATQGPLPTTTDDFWRLVWQEKVAVIIMLCCVMEKGAKKCEQYWPEKPGDLAYHVGLTIVNETVEEYKPDLQCTRLIVTGPGSDGTPRKHIVNHVLWNGWPDKGIPISTTGALRLIFRTQTLTPSIVHCSAGVGRTGTIIALEMCLRILASGNELSVYNIVRELRQRRFLSCQTDMQYLYVHRAILQYIHSKNIISAEETDRFNIDYIRIINERNGAGG